MSQSDREFDVTFVSVLSRFICVMLDAYPLLLLLHTALLLFLSQQWR